MFVITLKTRYGCLIAGRVIAYCLKWSNTISKSRVVELVGPEVGRMADRYESDRAWTIPGPLDDNAMTGGMDQAAVRLRTDGERAQAWTRVRRAVLSVVTNGLPNDYDRLDGVERFLFGVYNAARWIMTTRSTGPMSGLPRPATEDDLRRELSQAETQMMSRAEGWEYASGVMAWFLWCAGEIDDPLPLLSEPAFHQSHAGIHHDH